MTSPVTRQLIRLSKETLFYGVGSVIQKFIGFLLFPIYTRVLTPAAYGAQDLIFTGITIISYILILGLDSGTARNYYETKTPEDRTKVLSSYLWFVLIVSIPVSILLISWAGPICSQIFQDGSLVPYFRIGIAALPFSLVSSITLLTLRLTFQAKIFSIVTATSVLIQAGASILLVVILDMGVLGVFLSYFITNICRAIIGIVITHRRFGMFISLAWLKQMLAFGLPLVPASLSIWILNYSNRYFLIRLGSLSDIGLLSVGTKLASIMILVITAFRMAWGPFAYSLIDDESMARNTYSRVLTYYLLITLIATSALSIFSREIVLLLSPPAYEEAAFVVPLLTLSATIWGAALIVGIGYGIAKRSYHTTIATILGALANIAMNFVLIPQTGIFGAAMATMLGNLVVLVYSYLAAQRYFPVKYNFRRVIPLFAIVLITIAAASLIDRVNTDWTLQLVIWKFILVGTALFCLLVSKAIDMQEVIFFIKFSYNRLIKKELSL